MFCRAIDTPDPLTFRENINSRKIKEGIQQVAAFMTHERKNNDYLAKCLQSTEGKSLMTSGDRYLCLTKGNVLIDWCYRAMLGPPTRPPGS